MQLARIRARFRDRLYGGRFSGLVGGFCGWRLVRRLVRRWVPWLRLALPRLAGGWIRGRVRRWPRLFLRRRFAIREGHAADLFEFLERGQLAQVLQAELDQEFLGRLVQHRLADDVLAPGDGDQFAVEQRLEHAAALHAADLHDLRAGGGLLVRDHGQGFQRRKRELQRRLEALDEIADRLVMFRLSGHLVAAGHFANGDAVSGLVEFRDQLVEQVLDALHGLLQGRRDLRQGERFLGHIDDGFQNGFDLRVFLGDGGGSVVERDLARGHQLIHREGGLRRGIFRCGRSGADSSAGSGDVRWLG